MGRPSYSPLPPSFPDKLHYVEVKRIPDERCAQWMPNVSFGSMFCAGYEVSGKDSCQGDSGGPLFVEALDGNFVLVGIVSWGNGCAEERSPGVYTKIAAFKSW